MIDSALAIALGVLLIELARYGGFVSANPPTDPATAKRYTIRFRLYALVACVLVLLQGIRTYVVGNQNDAEKAALNSSITV
jgi:cytochrome c-type biogenesis protein CcmH/NrfF